MGPGGSMGFDMGSLKDMLPGLFQGRSKTRRVKVPEALEALDNARRLAPARADVLRWIGNITRSLGDIEGARKHLIFAVGDPELSLGATLALGRIAYAKGDLPEASRFLLQALQKAAAMSVEASRV